MSFSMVENQFFCQTFTHKSKSRYSLKFIFPLYGANGIALFDLLYIGQVENYIYACRLRNYI
jgi:hypothetical protein